MRNYFTLTCLALILSSSLHAEDSIRVPKVAAADDGFVHLFNGESLDGWSGSATYWSVEDGAITGKADGTLKRNHFLIWEGAPVRNFELRLKVKLSSKGNSGIQYRSQLRPDIGEYGVSGYQCDVVVKAAKYHGMLYEERGRRILSHTGEKVVVDPAGQPWVIDTMTVNKPIRDEWQEFRILARGNHMQHWIDGQPTADLVDLDESGRSLEGVIAVQVHTGPEMTVQYKDIRIKYLPDDLPLILPSDVQIPADAYGVRPQGRLPRDWKPPVFGEQ